VSRRTEKLNKLLHEEVAGLISREVSFGKGVLVTVTHVEVSQDNSEAFVFITCLPSTAMNEVFETLKEARGEIQHLLIKKLQMRVVPKISFQIDKGQVSADKVEEIIENIHNTE